VLADTKKLKLNKGNKKATTPETTKKWIKIQ